MDKLKDILDAKTITSAGGIIIALFALWIISQMFVGIQQMTAETNKVLRENTRVIQESTEVIKNLSNILSRPDVRSDIETKLFLTLNEN